MLLTSLVNINQTICGCDGSFAVQANNGTPPYSYSIDNGLSYRNTPLFTNLCAGLYSVIVKDVSGETATNSITLLKNNNFITYNLSLNTSNSTISDNGLTLIKKYETSFSVFPDLPSGLTITFNISHLNTAKSSPYSGSSTTTSVSTLTKNSVNQSLSYSSSTLSTTYNSNPGCQNQTIYINSLTEDWINLTLTNSDTISLVTYTTVNKNQDISCYLGTSEDIYSLGNVSISGCYCCNIIVT